MKYEQWEPYYRAILEDFGWTAEGDEAAAGLLSSLLPEDTLRNPKIPNSCQTCHKHKDQDLQQLQKEWEALSNLPKPVGKAIEPIKYRYTGSK